MKSLLIAFGLALALLAGGLLQKYTERVVPVGAVGLAVCGKLAGAVVVYSDGKQARLSPDEVQAVLPELEKLKPEQRALLTVCPKNSGVI